MGIWKVKPSMYNGLGVTTCQLLKGAEQRFLRIITTIENVPEVVVLETLPEKSGRDRLTVVHRTLGGVLAQDAIDYDRLLPA